MGCVATMIFENVNEKLCLQALHDTKTYDCVMLSSAATA